MKVCPDCLVTLRNPNRCPCGWVNTKAEIMQSLPRCGTDGCNRYVLGPKYEYCDICIGQRTSHLDEYKQLMGIK